MQKETAVTKVEPQAKTPVITPMQMLQIAVEKGADLDQMQKLMDLQERWEAAQAKKAYVHALNAFKADPPTVKKTKKARFGGHRGGQTEYDYATLPESTAAIAPALSKHGLSHRWSVSQEAEQIAVTCTLTHEMGHSESVTLRAPADQSGSKNSIQAIGSTVTYLERYTLLAITGLAAADQDDDGDKGGSDPVSEDQREMVRRLLDDTNSDIKKFCAWLKVESLADMRIAHFRQAMVALEQKKKDQAAS